MLREERDVGDEKKGAQCKRKHSLTVQIEPNTTIPGKNETIQSHVSKSRRSTELPDIKAVLSPPPPSAAHAPFLSRSGAI